MASRSVIEDLDVIEDIGTGELTGFVDAFADSFLFQATEEGFGYRIIPAITTPTHAGFQIVG